ncbi:unnamed protein product, partial [Allacma fusca]
VRLSVLKGIDIRNVDTLLCKSFAHDDGFFLASSFNIIYTLAQARETGLGVGLP